MSARDAFEVVVAIRRERDGDIFEADTGSCKGLSSSSTKGADFPFCGWARDTQLQGLLTQLCKILGIFKSLCCPHPCSTCAPQPRLPLALLNDVYTLALPVLHWFRLYPNRNQSPTISKRCLLRDLLATHIFGGRRWLLHTP